MTARIQYENGTVASLVAVESIQRVPGGVMVKCFGNEPVLHRAVIAVNVIAIQ
jgi:hypothetical protein